MVFQGPIVKVVLAPHPDDAAATVAAGGIPKTLVHNLMVDTGAQSTCVEDKIAQALGLVPVRYAEMMGVSGKPENYPVYRMAIVIGMSEDGTGAGHQANFVADVVGTPSPPVPLTHVGLIGRDFLKYMKLVYDGPKGTFDIIDETHVSQRYKAPRNPPALPGWKGIENARRRGRKHRRK